jgi:hypothetical protein
MNQSLFNDMSQHMTFRKQILKLINEIITLINR